MDDAVGDLPSGDVHVRDGAIVAVAANVNAPGAQVIDGKGMICMPGFVDTHWHHWTTFLRPVMRADDPKRTYFPVTFALGPHYTPEDSYRSVRLGLAEALERRRHHDAQLGAQCAQPGACRRRGAGDARQRPARPLRLRAGARHAERQADGPRRPGARMKRDIGNDPMLTLGICSRNIDGNNTARGAINADDGEEGMGRARASSACRSRCTPTAAARSSCSNEAGLLGPDVQLVHPLNTDAEDWEALAKHGVHYSISPLGEAGRSGEMQFSEMMQAGVQGEHLDRQRHGGALRLLRLHAHAADDQPASHRRQVQTHHQAAGADGDHRRRRAISASTSSPAR